MLISLAVFSTSAEVEDPLGRDMTIIGYQVSATPTSSDTNNNYYALRLVATHTNISNYSRFGYNVTIKYTAGGTEQTLTLSKPIMSGTVYKELSANNGDVIDLSNYDAEYFSAVEIIDIPMSADDLTITVTPTVVYIGERGAVDGTPVTFTHNFTTLTTMTFNIHNWNKSDAHLQRIKLAIKNSYPDVIGFQEMSNFTGFAWVDRLLADTELDSTYAYLGVSRDDSTREQAPIFYNKNKFDLVEWGTRWLYCEHGVNCDSTDCKGKTTSGSFEREGIFDVDDGVYYRVMTYAKLRCKDDPNKVVVFLNTHLETAGYNPLSTGYVSRQVQSKQIDYILNFAKDFTDAGIPVVLTGDFNAGVGTEVLNDIADADFVRAETESLKNEGSEENLSSSGYVYTDERNKAKHPFTGIDHIFIHAQRCYFLKYTFCEEVYEVNGVSEYASDHIPRIAEYALY